MKIETIFLVITLIERNFIMATSFHLSTEYEDLNFPVMKRGEHCMAYRISYVEALCARELHKCTEEELKQLRKEDLVTFYSEKANIFIPSSYKIYERGKDEYMVEECANLKAPLLNRELVTQAIERVLNAFAAPDNSFSIENFPFPCVKGASKEGLIYSFGQA